MPFSDLRKLVEKTFGPALLLGDYVPRETRILIARNLFIALIFLLFLVGLLFSIKLAPIGDLPGLAFISSLAGNVYGLALIVFTLTFVLSSIEAFHRSYYFRGLAQIIREREGNETPAVSWELATIVHNARDEDVLITFFESPYGQEILYRAGIREDDFAAFIAARTHPLPAANFVVEWDSGITLQTYALSIYKNNEEFRQFLAAHNVTDRQFLLAAHWVSQIEHSERLRNRWWSRDNLGRIPGIGKTWGYGETYLLDRYGHDLTEDHVWSGAIMSRHAEDDEVEAMETVLSRKRQANVLVVGNDNVAIREKVAQLYHKIREGQALPPLEGKRVYILDIETMLQAATEKASFEQVLTATFDQAATAGNIIMFIEHVWTAVASAHTIGTDLIDILLPYFDAPNTQIILGADTDTYHGHLAKDKRIAEACDLIRMQGVDNESLIFVLEQRALLRERSTDIVFTIPALETIARLADRYFPSGIMPDKAFDLLEELLPIAQSQHIDQLLQEDVERLVAEKTGIPMGTPTSEEREKLLSLEDFLHKRVVGQDLAVNAVSKALRRARAGVGGDKKPMGSFLFLGPTGVGKTETAKALAEALFHDENAMIRLDMSEFTGEDALERLIGSAESGRPGRLSTLIREQQYGVLLLDEFEKSDSEVHDLFLQVLDEGYFTDAEGKRVNARNLIIIATSNAGADLIWNWEKEGKDLAASKHVLMDNIIERGLFRPEFLNRFDDIITFNTLKKDQVKEIAMHQLTRLKERMHNEHNIELTVTDELATALATIGYDPQFGGRPMNRAIKDRVEQGIADRLLADTLHPGDTLTLTPGDIGL